MVAPIRFRIGVPLFIDCTLYGHYTDLHRMSIVDWIVLFGTLLTIVLYGAWKTRKNRSIEGYLLGGKDANWTTIGLSVMATQASAITFLSTPGVGFNSGMKFVQFYFGMPIALVVLSITVIPLFYKLKVFTAYEFLEKRFDLKTRLLAAFLFLVQRGMAAGITIYAPSIILSTVLGWDIVFTNIMVGVLVIIYTVSGGTKAVSLTQKWQMGVIMLGMFIAFGILLNLISDHIPLSDAVQLAGDLGKMEVVTFNIDFEDKYTVWAGIFGGFFLFMSYFGTDQSQVQRYLSGSSVKESRLGLMFNSIFKIPMQFFILFVGVMVFVLYQYESQPVYFNQSVVEQLATSDSSAKFQRLQAQNEALQQRKNEALATYKEVREGDDAAAKLAITKLQNLNVERDTLHQQVENLAKANNIAIKSKESDFVFIRFIMDYLPIGLIGLLIAVIFSAAMSSTAGELNALAATTAVDFYRRLVSPEADESTYLNRSKLFTVSWGVLAIIFSFVFSLGDNLIEVVNIIGSIFYGVILGIFLIAFYFKSLNGQSTFWGAIIAQLCIFVIYVTMIHGREEPLVGYLWLNFIGTMLTIVFALLHKLITGQKTTAADPA